MRISHRREDSGVAEIVGAILLFAVVITLFTSFMVWYVPTQTANNESHYELQTKSSLGSLVSDIHGSPLETGSTISSSVPLGISGVSIFSSAQQTEFFLLPDSSNFSATLSFNVSISAIASTGGTSTHYFTESYSAGGIMGTNGNTEYITAINYIVADGTLFQNYGNRQPTNSLGPMPVGITSHNGLVGLNLEIFGLTGLSEVFSSSQSQVVNILVNSSQSFSYVNGSIAALSGSQYTISGIQLNSLNYTFNGSLSHAWDYAMFSQFNDTQPGYSGVLGLPSWKFTSEPFTASLAGSSLSIVNSAVVNMSSLSTEAVTMQSS